MTTKLDPNAAQRIARLFNSLAVAAYMKGETRRDLEAGSITTAQKIQRWDEWDASEQAAARTLRDVYGIRAIGVSIRDDRERAEAAKLASAATKFHSGIVVEEVQTIEGQSC
jgi:hypothetical protein